MHDRKTESVSCWHVTILISYAAPDSETLKPDLKDFKLNLQIPNS